MNTRLWQESPGGNNDPSNDHKALRLGQAKPGTSDLNKVHKGDTGALVRVTGIFAQRRLAAFGYRAVRLAFRA